MRNDSKQWLIGVVALAAVGALLVPFVFASAARSSWSPPAGGAPYAGSSVGMGSMMGSWGHLGPAQPDSTEWTSTVSESNGTLTFSGNSIRILVLMGPMNGGGSMYSFEIDNITNPTLVFPVGATVTMVAVNVDTDAYHGLTIGRLAPPYGYTVMVGMMSSIATTRMLPPSSSGFASQQISFTVYEDAYYYCPVPGHAQLGMYGLIREG